jgi:hypothetical protein
VTTFLSSLSRPLVWLRDLVTGTGKRETPPQGDSLVDSWRELTKEDQAMQGELTHSLFARVDANRAIEAQFDRDLRPRLDATLSAMPAIRWDEIGYVERGASIEEATERTIISTVQSLRNFRTTGRLSLSAEQKASLGIGPGSPEVDVDAEVFESLFAETETDAKGVPTLTGRNPLALVCEDANDVDARCRRLLEIDGGSRFGSGER